MMETRKDCLLLWCTEAYEHFEVTSGFRLLKEKLEEYRDSDPSAPIFYAPVNKTEISKLIAHQPDGITLIAQNEGFQDSHWQIREIIRLMREKSLKTVEVIGHLDRCLDIAGSNLGCDGRSAIARYLDGRTKVFE